MAKGTNYFERNMITSVLAVPKVTQANDSLARRISRTVKADKLTV
jgi:hypothetical protein